MIIFFPYLLAQQAHLAAAICSNSVLIPGLPADEATRPLKWGSGARLPWRSFDGTRVVRTDAGALEYIARIDDPVTIRIARIVGTRRLAAQARRD